MRVLHIISGDLWAGAEVQVFNTLLALRREEDVQVACVLFNHAIFEKKLKEHGFQYFVVDEARYNSISMLVQLVCILREYKPDILHVHRNKEHFLGVLSELVCDRKVRIFRTVHGLGTVPNSLPLVKRIRSTFALKIDLMLIKYATNTIITVSRDLQGTYGLLHPKGKIVLVNNSVDIISLRSESVQWESESKFGIGTISG